MIDQDGTEWVRCLLCNREVARDDFDVHYWEECDGAPLYEEIR